jgi:hypothetical protein
MIREFCRVFSITGGECDTATLLIYAGVCVGLIF